MKDHIRDYATAAFRFYAKNGMSAEWYKRKIYEEALEEQSKFEKGSGVSKPTEAAIMRAEIAVNAKLAEIKDMEAVEKTIAEFKATAKPYIARAIEHVYFKDADIDIMSGDIQDRVHRAVLDLPASESSIYRYLRKAREIFAENRGLRI